MIGKSLFGDHGDKDIFYVPKFRLLLTESVSTSLLQEASPILKLDIDLINDRSPW